MVATSFSRNSRRNSRESTRTGRKKPGRQDTHLWPSKEMPPPGTIMWTCGWWVSADPQVCSTEVTPIARGIGVLATIGATPPLVGLFGTVWGIMDSFIGISKTNTTNLAVVAPGIAEALLATAMGLFA